MLVQVIRKSAAEYEVSHHDGATFARFFSRGDALAYAIACANGAPVWFWDAANGIAERVA